MHKQLGGHTVFRGPMYQHGYGLGGYFRKFFKWVVPIAEKHAVPHIKAGLNALKTQALDTVSSIAKDAVNGKHIRNSITEHVSQAIDNLKSKAEKTLNGEGCKRTKQQKGGVFKKKKIILKKRKDIFD